MTQSPHFKCMAILYSCLLIIAPNLPAKANSCYPNDPNGENPGNLCFPNLANPQQSGINQSSFQQGYASEGYYGFPTGPRIPGSPVVPSHQPGTPIDRRLGNNGYWKNIDASESGTTLKTNTGREWKIQPIRFP